MGKFVRPRFISVEWDTLRIGDIVCINGRLHRLKDNTHLYGHNGPGTCLQFAGGHVEVAYDLRDKFGELQQFLRAPRPGEEGYVRIPEERLEPAASKKKKLAPADIPNLTTESPFGI